MSVQFSSVQLLSCVQLFVTSRTAALQASLSITNSQSLFELMSIKLVMSSNHLILCLLFPPSFFPSIRVFSNKSVLHIRWPKYWSFTFRISPSNEYSGWISFRMDWFNLLAAQGTLKSLLQYHSSKAPILGCSACFIFQLSHPYMTTGKTIALTVRMFVSKVMSLLFNTLSRLVIAFLPRSKHLLILWLQSPSAVILEPKKIKSVTVFIALSICHEVMGPDAMIFVFWILSIKPAFSLSSFNFIKRLFSSSLLSAIRVVSSAYLRLLIFFLTILIPACASSSLAFRMMYSAHKLNKQGDKTQPWHTPFPIWNQSVVPYLVLTVASLPAYRFLRKQVRWSGIPIWLPRWLSGKESTCQCRRRKRLGFNPWVGKIPWCRKGTPHQYTCLENSKGRGAWQGYNPWGHKESDTTEWLSAQWVPIFLVAWRMNASVLGGMVPGDTPYHN